MDIGVFTEGTVLMHQEARDVPREVRVRQSKLAGIQREEVYQKFGALSAYKPEQGSVHDYENYVPVGEAVDKLKTWKGQGVTIKYISSRRAGVEIDAIRKVLAKYGFPDCHNLVFRQEGEGYEDVIERAVPDVLIEDDCESIGGNKEMIYTRLRAETKQKVRSVSVREFGGIDQLPEDVKQLS